MTLKISIARISKPIYSSLFSPKNALFWHFFFSKSHGGGVGGVGMKHEGPLGLNKPKTFSYWDFKNFNISNLITIFQWFLSHFGGSWAVWWCDGPALLHEFRHGYDDGLCQVWKLKSKDFKNYIELNIFNLRRGTYTSIHPSGTYKNHSEPNIVTQVGSQKVKKKRNNPWDCMS